VKLLKDRFSYDLVKSTSSNKIGDVISLEPIKEFKSVSIANLNKSLTSSRVITGSVGIPVNPRTKRNISYTKLQVQDLNLSNDLKFIISPEASRKVLESVIQTSEPTDPQSPQSVVNEDDMFQMLEVSDDFELATKLKELTEEGKVEPIFYSPKLPEKNVPLRFRSVEESLKEVVFNINSPIINYWEAIDVQPLKVDIPIRTEKNSNLDTISNIPKNYIPFAKTKKLNIKKTPNPNIYNLPAIGDVDRESVTQEKPFYPYKDKHGIMYSCGRPISKELNNNLWKYYSAAGKDHGLSYITDDVRFTYPSIDEVKKEFFNSLALDGLVWPDKLPSWIIPHYQQNEKTNAGAFLVFNPKLYKAAERIFGFNSGISLSVETPKENFAEVSFDRSSKLPNKIVLMLKGNDKDNIKSFKTSDPFVDSTTSTYEVITDINEMSERFTPPGEVIYIHYDDPILRLLLHYQAKIEVSRTQFTLNSFGDKELIHTIPHSYIIIPTDDPTHTSLRGTGSKTLKFGHRTLNLTQSTVPDEWSGPTKDVMRLIGSYIDVWGREAYMNYYLGDDYHYPEGTFKLEFSDTTKDFNNFKRRENYVYLTKTVFEEFQEAQDSLLDEDKVPSFNEIISTLSLDNILLLSQVGDITMRELVEGEVTNIRANLEVNSFNPAQDSFYISTGDAVNDALNQLLNTEDSVLAESGDTFDPIDIFFTGG
jgi:hypothetical protein